MKDYIVEIPFDGYTKGACIQRYESEVRFLLLSGHVTPAPDKAGKKSASKKDVK